MRHPFSRLVSVYKSKFERYSEKYYIEYAVNIMKNFREKALEVLPEEAFKTVVDLDGMRVKIPTFWEFIEFVLASSKHGTEYMDDFWRPITKSCQVCDVNYNLIIKVENPTEQVRLADKIGLNSSYK